jgi:hypothetical protein
MFFTAWGLLGLALTGSGLVASPHREADAAVRVWTYNYAGAAPETIARAQQEASRILERAGGSLEWVDCPRTAGERELFPLCRQDSPLRPVVLRIHSGRPPAGLATSPHVFGRAHLDENGNGYLADVYTAGANVLAKASPTQRASVLGHLIAHELGHIFLASSEHARSGIMRPKWDKADLRLALSGGLLFNAQQATRIASNLKTRARQVSLSASARRLHKSQ